MKKRTRILLAHGYKGNPKIPPWYPWLKKELEARGFEVRTPQFPNPDAPVPEEWSAIIEKELGGDFENTILVGHSLGGLAILRAIADHTKEERVRMVILVGVPSSDVGRPAVIPFLPPLHWTKIKKNAASVLLMYSKDDPYVPFAHAEEFQKQLGGTLKSYENKRHFQDDREFPGILGIILANTVE